MSITLTHQTPWTDIEAVKRLFPSTVVDAGLFEDDDVLACIQDAADHVAEYRLEIYGLVNAMAPMSIISFGADFQLRNVVVGAGVRNARGETTTVAQIVDNAHVIITDDIITTAPLYPDVPTPGAAWASMAVPYGFVPMSYILGGGMLVENLTGATLALGPMGKQFWIEDLVRREKAERYKAASFLSDKFFANEQRLMGLTQVGAGLASVRYSSADVWSNPFEQRFQEIVGPVTGAI